MISTLKTKLTAAIMVPVAYFQLRAVEINLEGMLKAREQVDPFTRIQMAQAIYAARAEALRLQDRYIALRRASQNWRAA